MSESAERPNQQIIERGYEPSDVQVGRLFVFAAGVVGLIIFGVVVSAAVFHFFVGHQSLGPPASPFENGRTLAPEPRLQILAPLDLKAYRADQEKTLEGYGWVDSHAGIVRIPIDRAMELLLQKGYPLRGSSPENGQVVTPGPPAGSLIAPNPVGGAQVR